MSNDKHETRIGRLVDYLTADTERGSDSFGDETPIGAGADVSESTYLSMDRYDEIKIDHNGRTFEVQAVGDDLEIVEVDDAE